MILICVIGLGLAAGSQAATAPAGSQPAELSVREFLVIDAVGRAGRSPIHTDAIEARIVTGETIVPHEGDSIVLPDGSSKTWQRAKVGGDGTLVHDALRDGYAYASVECDSAGVWLLEAAGHGLVYVNGVLRTGDPYSLGFLRLPVRLERGVNHFLFQGSRGKLRARLIRPQGDLVFLSADATTPSLRKGTRGLVHLALPIANCTEAGRSSPIRVYVDGVESRYVSNVNLVALSVVKQPIYFDPPEELSKAEVEVRIVLEGERADTVTIRMPVVGPVDLQKKTFVSEIDRSVQYYSVRPARPFERQPIDPLVGMPRPDAGTPLILSLHGADVEATGQAAAYGGTWADIVAPTNRRKYGFDWEDWGRLDAIEVLDRELQALPLRDARRVYLSGHSMGGHGTWQLGVTFPQRFAAIGPSAGWISFWSYGGMKRLETGGPAIELLQRAANPSDTLSLLTNLAPRGVYILHGDADDNVPVAQAREMREKLAAFHHDFQWHEQPGAGHWWGSSDEPGEECVDWPPMMDFFARRQLPLDGEVREVDFVTASPGVSATCHWLAIEQQIRPLAFSRAKLRCDPLLRRFVGTTENVRRLSLDVAHLAEGPLQIELDGQKIADVARPTEPSSQPARTREDWRMQLRRPGGSRVHLERLGDVWRSCTPAPACEKGPHRCGPFKAAFDNRFVLVVGTRGTAEENAWALAKARFDAETWWYRGNGFSQILTDEQLLRAKGEQNVILYGNASTNGAWTKFLADSPVQVERGRVRIGLRELRGDDLACLLVRPIAGSETASVGVVAGTGLSGMRLANRVPYFVSGVAFPDCTVLRADTLSRGAAGIRATGFFGHDWRIETGEFGFSD